MNKKIIKELFKAMGFNRQSGTEQELKAAKMIQGYLKDYHIDSHLEEFEVSGTEVVKAEIIADGRSIPCTGYRDAKEVDKLVAPFYYLRDTDEYSLSKCKGAIVLKDGYMNKKTYEKIYKSGAVAFISTNGTVTQKDFDIDTRDFRETYLDEGIEKLPAFNINIKEAIRLIEENPKELTISLKLDTKKATSHNVVAYLKGEVEEEILVCAHYDSVPLSLGIYDNLSGTIGVLAIAEKLRKNMPHYSIRFVFFGSEERGLLGSKAYVEKHKDELDKVRLCVNLDMIGSILGKSMAICTSEMKLVNYLDYFAQIKGYALSTSQGVASSDSTPLSDNGIPSVSFGRFAAFENGIYHNRYDTIANMSMEHMSEDINFVTSFIREMMNAEYLPVKREIPSNMKEEIDKYYGRKKDK